MYESLLPKHFLFLFSPESTQKGGHLCWLSKKEIWGWNDRIHFMKSKTSKQNSGLPMLETNTGHSNILYKCSLALAKLLNTCSHLLITNQVKNISTYLQKMFLIFYPLKFIFHWFCSFWFIVILWGKVLDLLYWKLHVYPKCSCYVTYYR